MLRGLPMLQRRLVPSERSNRHQHLWWMNLLWDLINTSLLTLVYTTRDKWCFAYCDGMHAMMHGDEQGIAQEGHLQRINTSLSTWVQLSFVMKLELLL
jgi:hypothetical protein